MNNHDIYIDWELSGPNPYRPLLTRVITAALAADALLNIIGIDTSFVLYPDGDRIIFSARSIGDTNVQVILEKLGGGGNAAAAGGQIQGKTLDQVAQELAQAIDQYLEE